MPDLDKVLQVETFKGQCETVEQRVFYTLYRTDKIQTFADAGDVHRVAKCLALLIANLNKKRF